MPSTLNSTCTRVKVERDIPKIKVFLLRPECYVRSGQTTRHLIKGRGLMGLFLILASPVLRATVFSRVFVCRIPWIRRLFSSTWR
jgi:hypothetical protein